MWQVLWLTFAVVIAGTIAPQVAAASEAGILAEPIQIGPESQSGAAIAEMLPAHESKAQTSGLSQPDLVAEVIELANSERAKMGLLPLKQMPNLGSSALGHSVDMAEHNFFSHDSVLYGTLSNRFLAKNYVNWQAGAENIAAGYATPTEVVAAWMKSPGHRANILNPALTEIGIGYVYQANDQANVLLSDGRLGGPYHHYWTMDLGARANVYPLVINNEERTTFERQVQLAIHGAGWAQQVQISNRSDFAGASWEPYVAHKSWTLESGNGPRTVYAKLRSLFGQEVVDSDTVELTGQSTNVTIRAWSFLPLLGASH